MKRYDLVIMLGEAFCLLSSLLRAAWGPVHAWFGVSSNPSLEVERPQFISATKLSGFFRPIMSLLIKPSNRIVVLGKKRGGYMKAAYAILISLESINK